MSAQPNKKQPVPRWVWLFAAACIAIPVLSLGGAIPGAIGVGGAFYCVAVARQSGKTTRRKLVHCAAATAACWALFLGLAAGVVAFQGRLSGLMQSKQPPPVGETQNADPSGIAQQTSPLPQALSTDEAKRREIYARAVRTRKHLELAIARRSELLDKGYDTNVADKQIEHIREMHKKRLEFISQFYKISREQLELIIAEGDRNRWPTE